MKKLTQLLIGMLVSGQVFAAAGGFDDWLALGDVSTQAGRTFLTTASAEFADDYPAAIGAFNYSGIGAASVGAPPDVEDFAGLPVGALDPDAANGIVAYEGSVVRRTFSVNAGDTLSFDWRFYTNEGGNDDYAFFIIDGVFNRLADVSWADGASTGFAFESALGLHTHQFLQAGNYEVVFGVVDVGDYNVTSALSFGNVQVIAVPEPEQYALLLAGLGLLAAAVKRRKNT